MSAFLKCQCPHCGIKIEFASEDAGRSCDCPTCGNALQLPIPSANLINETKPVAPSPQIIYAPPQTIYVKEKPKTGCLTQIIAAFLILMLIGFIISLFDSASNSPTSSPPAPASKSNTAQAEIKLYGDSGLIVSNMGTDTWDTITLYVDSDPPFGYSCTIGPVKHLDSKVIALRDFVKDNGERFNPDANKVVKVWIGGGNKGYDYESYGF